MCGNPRCLAAYEAMVVCCCRSLTGVYIYICVFIYIYIVCVCDIVSYTYNIYIYTYIMSEKSALDEKV